MLDNDPQQDKILTVPNLLSVLRIILIIPFIYYFLNEDYIMSAVTLSISGLSDCFDGVIARKFNQISHLGMLLDPIADKLTLAAVIICVSIQIPIIIPTTVIMLIKELLMLIGGFILLSKNITVPPSKWYGKVATFIFYISTIIVVSLQTILNYTNIILTGVLFTVTTCVMICALLLYIKLFFKILDENKTNTKLINTELSKKGEK